MLCAAWCIADDATDGAEYVVSVKKHQRVFVFTTQFYYSVLRQCTKLFDSLVATLSIQVLLLAICYRPECGSNPCSPCQKQPLATLTDTLTTWVTSSTRQKIDSMCIGWIRGCKWDKQPFIVFYHLSNLYCTHVGWCSCYGTSDVRTQEKWTIIPTDSAW